MIDLLLANIMPALGAVAAIAAFIWHKFSLRSARQEGRNEIIRQVEENNAATQESLHDRTRQARRAADAAVRDPDSLPDHDFYRD
jgi:alkylhydroperoxidase family enzyme